MSLAEQILEIWRIDAEVAAAKHFLNEKGLPKRTLNTKFLKKCSVSESKSWWFRLEHELPSTQLLISLSSRQWLPSTQLLISLSSRQCHLDTQEQFWRWVYERFIFFQRFQSSENQSVNLFATVPPIAVVQVQDHRPQQPQTSPAALRKDHIEKSSHSACWSPPSSLKWCCTFPNMKSWTGHSL